MFVFRAHMTTRHLRRHDLTQYGIAHTDDSLVAELLLRRVRITVHYDIPPHRTLVIAAPYDIYGI